ncbi:MAG: DUF11 domain-containing protein, partial [Myxococcota bacterium]
TIPTAVVGDNSRKISFQVRVDPEACGGSITNSATLSAAEISDVVIGPAVTPVDDVSLDEPSLSVAPVSAPPIGPTSIVRYTLDFPNSSGRDIGGVSLELDIPQFVAVSEADVFATSGTVSLAGDRLTVTDLVVESDGSARVSILARVLSEAELNAAGVDDDDIDGLVVSAQGLASGGCGAPQLTDDPQVVGEGQATEFVLFYRPDLTPSVKEVSDVNGAPLEPDDVLRYRIVVENSGNRPAVVSLDDPVPAFTSYLANSTLVDGANRSDVGGAFPFATGAGIGSVPAGGSREIVFDVVVDTMAPNGSEVVNVAEAAVSGFPDANVTLTSPTLRVLAAPDLDGSRKTVSDETAPLGRFEPGDEVEYALVIENQGNRPATDLVVTDPLPDELTFLSASDGGSESGGVVTWSLADLEPEETRTLTIRARLLSPLDNETVVTNWANVATAELPDEALSVSFTVESAPVSGFRRHRGQLRNLAHPQHRRTLDRERHTQRLVRQF